MTKVRLYLDEHVSRAVARGLRQRGADVVTVTEAGMRGAPDEEHLRHALSEARAVFTQDADFLRMHAGGTNHAGIIYAPPGSSTRRVLRGLLLVLEVLDAEELAGHVEYI